MKSIVKNGLRSNNLVDKKFQSHRESEKDSLFLTSSYKIAYAYSLGNKYQRPSYNYKYIVRIPPETVNQEDLVRDRYDVEHNLIGEEQDEKNPSYRVENTIITDFCIFQVVGEKYHPDFLPLVRVKLAANSDSPRRFPGEMI